MIILASTSPRRNEILQGLKIPFQIKTPRFKEETAPHLSPEAEAIFFALEKAKSIIDKTLIASAPHLIIGSDTLLALENEKIGKPKDEEDAFQILKKLRGKTHQILSSLALLQISSSGQIQEETHLEKVSVSMKNYSDEEIQNYLQLDQPWDKAGAYSIQENAKSLMKNFEGEFEAAMGLPLTYLKNYLAHPQRHF
ncbi:MAG: septum formation protein Maf [Deltaproteobacteria bacterium]|nr:septum formation protein Maf [Deltaproteobacteria bacterium]